MPRPPDSRTRRIMMQGIMWVILAATVGLAALVNQSKRNSQSPSLDAKPRKLEDVTFQLPRGWVQTDELEEFVEPNESAIAVKRDDEILVVSIRKPSLSTLLNLSTPGLGSKIEDSVPIGDTTAPLYRSQKRGHLSILNISRPLRMGRRLEILLATYPGPLEGMKHEIDLIKRIAASVKIEDEPVQ